MNITRIDHINIAAPGPLLEQVRDFYCQVLGLENGFRPDFSSSGYWLYAGDSPLVHLSLSGSLPDSTSRGHLDHVAFHASGLQAMIKRLEAAGIKYRCSDIPQLELSQLFFVDPAGVGIEVNFRGEQTVQAAAGPA